MALVRQQPDRDRRDEPVRAGQARAGGSYVARSSQIALWDTTMDEHNYLVRRWSAFAATMSA